MMQRLFVVCFVLLEAICLLGCSSSETRINQNVKDSSGYVNEHIVSSLPIVKQDSTIVQKIEHSTLPEACKYKGDFLEAFTWIDKGGENFLILSFLTKSRKDLEAGEDVSSKELFARQYRMNNPKMELVWELYDTEKDCIFDLTAEYLLTPIFTDLDKDEVKESWLVYKLACRSDVSPARMKIVMHEGKDKYALRGLMYIPMNADEAPIDIEKWEPDYSKTAEDGSPRDWGRFESAKDFEKAPMVFQKFGEKLWLENFIEG